MRYREYYLALTRFFHLEAISRVEQLLTRSFTRVFKLTFRALLSELHR